MSQFTKSLKIFSASAFPNTSSYLSGLPIKTNVIRRNGVSPVSTFGGVSSSIIQLPDNEIPSFFSIIDDMEQFRYMDFTKNILLLLTTDIVNLIDDTRPICVIREADEEVNARVNRILERHKVRTRIRESIPDIVYYGSISYLTKLGKTKDGKKVLELYDLENPYSVITREYNGVTSYIMPGTTDLEIDKRNILYMGSGDFKLKPLSADYVPLLTEQKGTDYQIVSGGLSVKASKAMYHGSEPLFYSLVQKVKLYNIKDLLSTILSLRDAIQPTLMTLNQEITRHGSDSAEFENASQNIESLINRLSDSSISISEILDIDVLVNAVFSSIRVLPDPGGQLQSLNTLNLEEFKDKLQRLKDGIDDIKKDVLESLGIPGDLWEGSSNSNEVYQKNERLQTVVSTKLNVVKISSKKFIVSILNQVAPELKITEDMVELKMFRKSSVEYAKQQKEVSLVKENLQLLSETLSSASEVIDSNRFIDPKSYYNNLTEQLTNISPEYAKLIKPIEKIRFGTEENEDEDKY